MKLDTKSLACTLKGDQKIFNIHIDQTNSCCKAYPEKLSDHTSIKQLIDKWNSEKVQLEQGQELHGCEMCWKHEHKGILSHRQHHGTIDHGNTINIMLSNACNQMCSYCSPQYSTTWQESIRTYGLFKKISRSTNQNLSLKKSHDIDEKFWIDEIKNYMATCEDNSIHLQLLGGEPLMQKSSLDKFLNLQNSKIRTLKIVTNLNPPDNKFLIWILNQYSNNKLFVEISLDASPDFNHIPRAGFDSKKFLDNLDLLKKYQIDFKFSPTVSALSIFDLPEFLQWNQKNNFPIPKFFRIHNPLTLDPVVVPFEFRSQILESTDPNLLPENVQKILTEPTPAVDLKLFEQYNYLEQYFARTGIDPDRITNDLFVQYWNWLKRKFT